MTEPEDHAIDTGAAVYRPQRKGLVWMLKRMKMPKHYYY